MICRCIDKVFNTIDRGRYNFTADTTGRYFTVADTSITVIYKGD